MIQYKCPKCAANMEFDAKSGRLSCEFCGHSLNIQEFAKEVQTKGYIENIAREKQMLPKKMWMRKLGISVRCMRKSQIISLMNPL